MNQAHKYYEANGLKRNYIFKIEPLLEQLVNNKVFSSLITNGMLGEASELLTCIVNSEAFHMNGFQPVKIIKCSNTAKELALYELRESERLSINVVETKDFKPTEAFRPFVSGVKFNEGQIYDRPTIVIDSNPVTHNILFDPETDFSIESFWGSISVYSSSFVSWAKSVGLKQSVSDISKHPSTHMMKNFKSYLTIRHQRIS